VPKTYRATISATLDKATFYADGQQTHFIQKMADFFWDVGASESEIDRLNHVGGSINPLRVGYWIELSNKGGMDGGGYLARCSLSVR